MDTKVDQKQTDVRMQFSRLRNLKLGSEIVALSFLFFSQVTALNNLALGGATATSHYVEGYPAGGAAVDGKQITHWNTTGAGWIYVDLGADTNFTSYIEYSSN